MKDFFELFDIGVVAFENGLDRIPINDKDFDVNYITSNADDKTENFIKFSACCKEWLRGWDFAQSLKIKKQFAEIYK